MSDLDAIQQLAAQLERIAGVLEGGTAASAEACLDDDALAWRWESYTGLLGPVGRLVPVEEPNLIAFADLQNVARQKSLIEQNTRQFVAGRPANNVLMTGARGTGKSSLVRACLHAFHTQGLRLIEVDKEHLTDLPRIVGRIRREPFKFIIFCDDLTFDEGEYGYKNLKTVLDGSVAGSASNVLVYATSNRRHLLPEHESDNRSYSRDEDGELHPGDVVEEKISLSERFGLWITFYSFSQDEYLTAVRQWLAVFGGGELDEDARLLALQWAIQRGSRSGRVAMQFARDHAGRQALR